MYSKFATLAEMILNRGLCRLSEIFKEVFPDIIYKADTAKSLVLRAPLACVRVGDVALEVSCLLVMEHIQGTNYEASVSLRPALEKAEVKQIMRLAQSERERQLLWYAIYKSSGVSSGVAKKVFGFNDTGEHCRKVEVCIEVVQSIHESFEDRLAAELGALDISDQVEDTDICKKAVQRKLKREYSKNIAGQGFLSRKEVSHANILTSYPDIGEVIESFVQECSVGADSWRRTGLLTFDGNVKVNKKCTYKRIQEHLECYYGRKFSYGTVNRLNDIKEQPK